jgi:hypothetical protein
MDFLSGGVVSAMWMARSETAPALPPELDGPRLHVMDIPLVSVAPHTLVFNRKENVALMRIHGVVALPIGAEIEIADLKSWARVTGVRLLASVGDAPAMLCLDVEPLNAPSTA